MSVDEFKSLWLLEKDGQMRTIEERLFGGAKRDMGEGFAQDDKYLDEVIRQTISEEVIGPRWIGINHQPGGTCVFMLRQKQDDAERTLPRIPSEERRALQAMFPIQRYAACADDAKVALRAYFK